jgi:hypothetical protein
MDSEALASMYAEIVRGTPKEESRWCKDDEASATWDEISSQVDAIRKAHPGALFDIP